MSHSHVPAIRPLLKGVVVALLFAGSEMSLAASPDATAGAELYAAQCASCHGPQGEGVGIFPKVTGLGADEIISKLKAYRAGEQVGPNTALMAPNAAGLTDEDIANLAAHLGGGAAAAEEAPPAEETAPAEAAITGKATAGAEMYAAQCASCHGPQGEGMGMFPKVAGLSADEITSKMKAYRAGEQVGPNTALMAPNAAGLTDEDIANLAAHLGGGTAAAEEAPPAEAAITGNATAGAELYAAQCASCHGPQGEGMGMFPKVAGLSADEITSKMKAYRAGEQVGPNTALMAPNAAGLTDDDIANLAAHLGGGTAAAEEAPPAEETAPATEAGGAGDVAAGKTLYASSCASCHGANAEGQGMFPKLAGNAADDISTKLKAYRAGEQVGPMTSMMAPMAAGLSDEDITNVSAYLSGL